MKRKYEYTTAVRAIVVLPADVDEASAPDFALGVHLAETINKYLNPPGRKSGPFLTAEQPSIEPFDGKGTFTLSGSIVAERDSPPDRFLIPSRHLTLAISNHSTADRVECDDDYIHLFATELSTND